MSKSGSEGPSATSFDNPRKVGWLNKRGGSGVGAHWRKRWFIADHHYLFYYKTPNDKKPVGILCLPDYGSCHREDAKEWKKPNTFVVDRENSAQDSGSPDNAPTKNYILSSESEEDMLSWIKAITEEIKPMIGGEERRPGGGGGVSNGRPPAAKRKKTDGAVDPKAFDDVAALATEGPKLTHLTASRPKVRNRRPPKRYVVFHEDDSKPEDQSPPSTPATPTTERHHTPPSVSPSSSPQITPKRGHKPSAPLLPNMMSKSPQMRRGTTKTAREGTESPTQKLKFKKPPPPLKKHPSDQTTAPPEVNESSPPTPRKPVPPRKPAKDYFTSDSDLDTVAEDDSKQSKPVPSKRPRPVPPAKPRTGIIADDVTPEPATPTKRLIPVPRPVPVPRKRTIVTEHKPVLPEKELPPIPSKLEMEETKMEEDKDSVKTAAEQPTTEAEETPDAGKESVTEKTDLRTDEQIIELASEDELLDEELLVETSDEEIKKKKDQLEVAKKETENVSDQLYEIMESNNSPQVEVETTYEPMSFEEESSKLQEEHAKTKRHNYDEVPTESFLSNVPSSRESDNKPSTTPSPVARVLSESENSDSVSSPGYIQMDPASPLQFKDRQGSVDEGGYEKMKLGVATQGVKNASSESAENHEYVEPTEWIKVPRVRRVPMSDHYDAPPPRPLKDDQLNKEKTDSVSDSSSHNTTPELPRQNHSPEVYLKSSSSTSSREHDSSVDLEKCSSPLQPEKRTSANERLGSFNGTKETAAATSIVAITVEADLSSSRSDQPTPPMDRTGLDDSRRDSLSPRHLSHDSKGYTTVQKSAKYNGYTVDSERLSSVSSAGTDTDREPPEIIPMVLPEDQPIIESMSESVTDTLKQAKEILRLAHAVRLEADQMKQEAQRELELAKREKHDAELLKKNASEILRMAKEKFGVSAKK